MNLALLALSEAAQRALTFGVAAAVALAAWLLLLLILALATRPDLPDASPAGSDFGGDEPPAVVNFLVNRWELGHEAVPATLIDLAARGVVTIDQVAPERFIVRLRTRHGVQATQAGGKAASAQLRDYEEQVLGHIRKLASNGVVPCEALTTGPGEESSGWWKRFSKSVVQEARDRGLSRPRWSKPALTALGIVAVAPAALAAIAFVLAPTESAENSSADSKEENPIGAALGVGALGWAALMAIPASLRAERDTPAGRAAAAKWLGLRDYLQDNESFDRAPPAAVAIWDRYLSYGAAMGVAAGAVRALPLGAESDHEAWSSYGGKWHVVRIRYPAKLPPGWGQHPFKVAAKGFLLLAAAFVVFRTIGPPMVEAIGDFLDESDTGDRETVALVVTAVAGVILTVLTVVLLRAAVMFLFGVSDLLTRRTVEGQVIRLRNNYLAVDDGTRPRVRAWKVEPMKLGGAIRGSVVRVEVTPRLGYVHKVELAN